MRKHKHKGRHPLAPREVVRWFSRLMEAKLQQNDHRGGWRQCEDSYLMGRLQSCVLDLAVAIRKANGTLILLQAADVANFAMMVADNRRHHPERRPRRKR